MRFTSLTLLALPAAVANYQPDTLSSVDNVLDVTLTVDMATSLNGTRTAPGYNGSPVGPTLRVKPGDLLKVTLINNLDPVSDLDKELYAYTKDFSADAVNRTIVSFGFVSCIALQLIFS